MATHTERTQQLNDYAIYRGDEFIALGTIKELADFMGVKEASIRFWSYPSYLNRIKQYHNSLRVIKIEGSENE
jgi:hypothetical protein